MRESLTATLQAIGYMFMTSAAVWLVFRYVPSP